MKIIEIEQLATSFLYQPRSENLHHVSVYNAFEEIGGRPAIAYGMFLATPFQHAHKKRRAGIAVASSLEVYLSKQSAA